MFTIITSKHLFLLLLLLRLLSILDHFLVLKMLSNYRFYFFDSFSVTRKSEQLPHFFFAYFIVQITSRTLFTCSANRLNLISFFFFLIWTSFKIIVFAYIYFLCCIPVVRCDFSFHYFDITLKNIP